jgi:predicted RNase H-like HicB family nuclease
MKVLGGTFNIHYNKEAEGDYSDHCIELPAVISQYNKTIPDLTYNITQAIPLVILDMIKSGREEEEIRICLSMK